jgi:hypothetical protein
VIDEEEEEEEKEVFLSYNHQFLNHVHFSLKSLSGRVNVHHLAQAVNWRSLVKTSLELPS